MSELRFDPDDLRNARELLSQRNALPPSDADIEAVASAINVQRRANVADAVSDAELRAAHDQLCGRAVRHRGARSVLEALAVALLARGIVPDTGDYDGEWWLWWPKKGRGLCQHCGKERVLTRYMARFGMPERYLCQRCRKQENTDLGNYLDEVTGVTPEPGESADSLYRRRMTALMQQAVTAANPARRPGEPSGEVWNGYIDDLEGLLSSLEWAGWVLPDSYDTDFDTEAGALLCGELLRTGMVIVVQYEPAKGELLLLSCTGDEDSSRLSMLDDDVEISVGQDIARGAEMVAERAGELGLLDATRLVAASDSDISTSELIIDRIREWILESAAEYRDLPLDELVDQVMDDEQFPAHFEVLVAFLGASVLPDAIPDAAALGIAAWCWRNNTAVEDWHLPTDALMAKVNIAVTRAVQPHVDPVAGVDWQGVEDSLTDPSWRLQDGRVVSGLFAEGWPEVQRTVREQIRMWRHFDEGLIGPDATLRLLTIGGSTSYTRHWWGQGRWAAICREVVSDATHAGVPLPAPYDMKDADALLRDLKEPDALSDEVLAWMIDIPDAATDGPQGLRTHKSTRPIVRQFALYHLDIEEE